MHLRLSNVQLVREIFRWGPITRQDVKHDLMRPKEVQLQIQNARAMGMSSWTTATYILIPTRVLYINYTCRRHRSTVCVTISDRGHCPADDGTEVLSDTGTENRHSRESKWRQRSPRNTANPSERGSLANPGGNPGMATPTPRKGAIMSFDPPKTQKIFFITSFLK